MAFALPGRALAFAALLALTTAGCGITGDVSVGRNRPAPGAPPFAGVRHSSRSADSFVDSLGINTHFGRVTSVYGTARDTVVLPALAELGIRHIRESASADVLQALAGLSLGALMAYRGHPIDDAVVLARALGPQLEGVEGPSDSDFMPETFNYQGQAFPEGTRAYQADLFAAFQGDPQLALVPMALPTVYSAANAAVLGPLESGSHCNVHSREPLEPTPRQQAEQLLQQARVICGEARPMLATSVGYSTLEGHDTAVSEQVGAKYLLRSVLAYFALGVERVYIYELINEEPDPDPAGTPSRHRGLLRNDGSRKPAFTALANLVALTADPGEPLPTSELSYAVEGEVENLQQLLLQKRDGSFLLILWQEMPSWDKADKQSLVVPEVSISLVLEAAAQTIDVFRPLESPAPQTTQLSSARITLTVPDHPLVIRIVP